MTTTSDLNRLIVFQQRQEDANGERLGAWGDSFIRSAGVVYLRGGEAVMQQRLQSVQPAVMTVREDPETRSVTTAYRAVERTIDGGPERVYDIRGVAPAKTAGFLDMLVEANGLNGGP